MFYFILKTEQTDDFCTCSFYTQRSFFVFHVDSIFHIHCIIKTMTKELILILVVFALFKSYGKYHFNSQLPGPFAYPESNATFLRVVGIFKYNWIKLPYPQKYRNRTVMDQKNVSALWNVHRVILMFSHL